MPRQITASLPDKSLPAPIQQSLSVAQTNHCQPPIQMPSSEPSAAEKDRGISQQSRWVMTTPWRRRTRQRVVGGSSVSSGSSSSEEERWTRPVKCRRWIGRGRGQGG